MGIYLKSILAGVIAAVLACVLSMALTIAIVFAKLRFEMAANGSGGLGAASVGLTGAQLAFALPVGFAIGFVWMFRRLRRRAGKVGAT